MSSVKAVNLSALRARLWTARGNLSALEALDAELSNLSGNGFVALKQEVAASIKAQRLPAASPTHAKIAVQQAPADLVDRIKSRAKTSNQPLYRYGITDEEFAALRARLDQIHARGGLEQSNERSAAAFVIYCAEWFRREYDGGGYTWDAPYPVGPVPRGPARPSRPGPEVVGAHTAPHGLCRT